MWGWALSAEKRLISLSSAANPLNLYGSVAEWLKALVLKTSNGATRSWGRIPPLPPRSELPAFSFHEGFEGQAIDPEVLADIGDFRSVLLEQLHSHHAPPLGRRLGVDEGVGIPPALEKLLLLNLLLAIGSASGRERVCQSG